MLPSGQQAEIGIIPYRHPQGWSKPSEPLLNAKVDFNEQAWGIPSRQGSVPRPLPSGFSQQGAGCSCCSSLRPALVVVYVAQHPGCGSQEGQEHQGEGNGLFLRGTKSGNHWDGCAGALQHHTPSSLPCALPSALDPPWGCGGGFGEQSCSHWQGIELELSRLLVSLGQWSSA